MMVIKTCSLTVKRPGLRDIPKILTLGTMRAQRRTMGNEINCATTYDSYEMRTGTVRTRDTYTTDRDRGEAEEKELIESGDEDGPDETDEPRPESTAGHVCVVRVSDGRTNLGIRGVILYNKLMSRSHNHDAYECLPRSSAFRSRLGSSNSAIGTARTS